MRSYCKGLLFMHGHIADADLARSLADAALPLPARAPAPPAAWRSLLRRFATLLGWLGCGAVRAWPN